MRLQIIKVLGGGAIIWITAALTHDIYATAWANFFVGVISIIFVDAAPAKRLHGYSSLDQVRDVLPALSLSLVAAAASLIVQLLGVDYIPELFLQCILFAVVYLGGAKVFKFSELSEAASLFRGFTSRKS